MQLNASCKLQSNADCSSFRNQMKSICSMAASRCKITRLQGMNIFLLTDKSKSSSNYFYGINQYFQRPTYANWPEAVRIRIASVALEVELVSIKRTGDAARGDRDQFTRSKLRGCQGRRRRQWRGRSGGRRRLWCYKYPWPQSLGQSDSELQISNMKVSSELLPYLVHFVKRPRTWSN